MVRRVLLLVVGLVAVVAAWRVEPGAEAERVVGEGGTVAGREGPGAGPGVAAVAGWEDEDEVLGRFRVTGVAGGDEVTLASGRTLRRRVVRTAGSLGKLLVIEGEGEEAAIYSAEHLLVSATDPERLAEMEEVLVGAGLPVEEPFVGAGLLYVLLESDAPEEIEVRLRETAALVGDEGVAELDGVGWGGGVPSDPSYGSQWHHQKIKSEAAWDHTQGSTGITVAVLDTGLNTTLSEFAGRLVSGYDFVNSDADPTDDHGHGTAVAGVVAANANNGVLVAGVDWKCRIMPIKVLDSANNGLYSNWAAGVNFARTNGARVINLSAGGASPSTTLTNAINAAIAAGVIFVTITHNDSAGTIRYPGTLPQAITVGATERNDTRSDFSNWGSAIDLVAPGRQIYTVSRTGGLTNWLGTSFAAPQVAGAAALLLSIYPDLEQAEVSALLTVGAEDGVGDGEDTAGWDQYFGWGRLNVLHSILLAETKPGIEVLGDGRMRLSWAASANAVAKEPFTIEWREEGTGWTTIASPAISYGATTEWIDDGTETGVHPALARERIYRVGIGN